MRLSREEEAAGFAFLIWLVIFVVCLATPTCIRDACAEPLHIGSASSVTTAGGTSLDLPPGYFLPDQDFNRLDVELKRLQDAETQLKAENESLRTSLDNVPIIGVGQAAVVFVIGALVGGGVSYVVAR